MRIAPVLALAALTAPLAAQLTPQQATQQLKAAAKVDLGVHKSEMKAALAGLDAALQDFDSGAKAGQNPAGLVQGLFDDLQDFQDALVEATVFGTPLGATIDLLDELADGGDLQGEFPPGFLIGDGGVLDDHRDALRKSRDKTLAKARKRLAKSGARFLKAAGWQLTFVLEAPSDVGNLRYDEDVGSIYTNVPTTVDLALAASAVSETGDGRLFLGGSHGDTGAASLDIDLDGPGTNVDEQIEKDDGSFRWGYNASAGGGLPEGAYVVRVTGAGSSEFGADGCIGIP